MAEDGGQKFKQASTAAVEAVTEVFPGPLTFDKIVDELINSYYIEAERWLMHGGIRRMIKMQTVQQSRRLESVRDDFRAAAALPSPFNEGLDESFFVLQRCGQRAIATNNIHAACAILHLISDLLSSELLTHISDGLSSSTRVVIDAINVRVKSIVGIQKGSEEGWVADGDKGSDFVDKALIQGYRNAMQLASSIQNQGNNDNSNDKAYSLRIQSKLDGSSAAQGEEEDPYGVAEWMQVYNTAERCVRYTDRLGDDILTSGAAVFADSGANDGDKIRLCKEEYGAAAKAFRSVLTGELEALAVGAGKSMKDVLFGFFGPKGPLGGIKFDMPDDKFESQRGLVALPIALVQVMEAIIDLCMQSLSETNRTLLIGLLAEQMAERLEHFVTQHSFHFCGALKMEECVRAIIAAFNQRAPMGASLRPKFGRIREIMMVLTSDTSSSFGDTLTQLTFAEAENVLGLRL